MSLESCPFRQGDNWNHGERGGSFVQKDYLIDREVLKFAEKGIGCCDEVLFQTFYPFPSLKAKTWEHIIFLCP